MAPFPLLSDEGGKVAAQFGVDMPIIHFFKRTTFLIDGRGILRSIVPGMPDNSALLRELQSWDPKKP